MLPNVEKHFRCCMHFWVRLHRMMEAEYDLIPVFVRVKAVSLIELGMV
jgi:hypothetical protein